MHWPIKYSEEKPTWIYKSNPKNKHPKTCYTPINQSIKRNLTNSKPSHTNYNIQTPLLSPGILKRPHSIAVDIPERTGGRVHPTLSGVAVLAVRGSALVDDSLLHDSAVHGEAVGGRC